MWNKDPAAEELAREKKTHEEKIKKAKWSNQKAFIKVTNFTDFEADAPAGYSEHITFEDPGMTISEMHDYDTHQAMLKGMKWAKRSGHGQPTYPMNKTARLYNFPDSEEALKAAKAAKDAGAGSSFLAKFSNQGKLEELMKYDFLGQGQKSKLPGSEGTYVIHDSFSWLEPYYPRDHAWTWP